MCGRFTLRTSPSDISTLFDVSIPDPSVVPRYNIAPTQNVSVILQEGNSLESNRQWRFFRWGLVPSWAKDLSISHKLINARGETISEKPSFRSAFKKRRCLVLADGFYEWEKTDSGKQPHYFTQHNESVMAFAGLWEYWENESTVFSCTIITTTANSLLDPMHDRMPVILDSEDHQQWLDPDFYEKESLQQLIKPYSADKMTSRLVNKTVNHVKNETPDCLAIIEH
jgi:putative SOS response-associated peptidase YedK